VSAAQQQLGLPVDVTPTATTPVDDAPRLAAEDLRAFEAGRRTHPPAPASWTTEHAEWMRFSAERQLAALRADAPTRPASGGAPPRDFDDPDGA
jgi:hypothetical protein